MSGALLALAVLIVLGISGLGIALCMSSRARLAPIVLVFESIAIGLVVQEIIGFVVLRSNHYSRLTVLAALVAPLGCAVGRVGDPAARSHGRAPDAAFVPIMARAHARRGPRDARPRRGRGRCTLRTPGSVVLPLRDRRHGRVRQRREHLAQSALPEWQLSARVHALPERYASPARAVAHGRRSSRSGRVVVAGRLRVRARRPLASSGRPRHRGPCRRAPGDRVVLAVPRVRVAVRGAADHGAVLRRAGAREYVVPLRGARRTRRRRDAARAGQRDAARTDSRGRTPGLGGGRRRTNRARAAPVHGRGAPRTLGRLCVQPPLPARVLRADTARLGAAQPRVPVSRTRCTSSTSRSSWCWPSHLRSPPSSAGTHW